MIARIEVGHVQTLQADLASGCLHFLKNCIQHALCVHCVSPPILCLLCSKKAQSDDNAHHRYCTCARTLCAHASRHTHNTAAFPNQFRSYKTTSPLFNLLPNDFVSEATTNILPFPCFISYLRGKKWFSTNIWMLAGSSEKSYQIRSSYIKCNLKAHHLFI